MSLVVVLCVALLPSSSYAQESDLGDWLIFIGNKKINEKFNFHHEVQYRNYDAIADLEQLLLRTGIGYNLTNNANFLLGYGFIHSENYVDGLDEKVEVNEHRIFQQFITKQKLGKFGLQHRYRFEQRFVEDDFKIRFRYFLGLSHPLWTNEENGHQLYASMYNEIFLNGEQTVFDRNRLYGGLGYKLNPKLKFEVGYMNQFFNQAGRDQINLFCFYNW